MQRKFIINLALLLLLNFLIKPFWIFGIDRTVQNMVPSADYGIYFALFNFSILFSILLDLGLTNYNNKNIAQNNHILSKYFSGLLTFKFLLSLIYFLVTFVVGYVVGYDSARFSMLLFLSINQFLISLILFMRSNISGLQLFGMDSLLSVLDKVLMIIFCAVLLWGNVINEPFAILHFIYAQTAAYLLTAIVVFAIIVFKTKVFTFQLNLPFLLVTLKQTFPYAFLVLTMTFYYRLDAIMLDLMLPDGEHEAAIYAQAYRLLDATSQIGVLFAGLLLPMFALMIAQKQKLDDLLRLSFSLLFIPSAVLALFCLFYAEQIISLLYANHEQSSSNVLILLMFCFVAIAGTYVYGTLLTSKGSLKHLNFIAVIGLILNFVLNLILIPTYKAEGSAIASLITQFIVLTAQIFVCNMIFNFALNYQYIYKVALFFVVILAIIFGLKSVDVSLQISFLVTALLSSVLVFLFKIISLKDILQLIKNR
ncbi:MAG: oligosaccharide flippase family protein [Flavobacteriales bacterium]|nr:oligosaccharide flippase family protein [Flavobacteriales bacterium]